MTNNPSFEIIPIDPKMYEVIKQVITVNEKILAQNLIILETLGTAPTIWLNDIDKLNNNKKVNL